MKMWTVLSIGIRRARVPESLWFFIAEILYSFTVYTSTGKVSDLGLYVYL